MACVLYTCLRCDHYQRHNVECEKCGFDDFFREYDEEPYGEDEDDGRDEEE